MVGLNRFYVEQYMVPQEKARPRCRVHGIPMEDDDRDSFFCVACVDERPHQEGIPF